MTAVSHPTMGSLSPKEGLRQCVCVWWPNDWKRLGSTVMSVSPYSEHWEKSKEIVVGFFYNTGQRNAPPDWLSHCKVLFELSCLIIFSCGNNDVNLLVRRAWSSRNGQHSQDCCHESLHHTWFISTELQSLNTAGAKAGNRLGLLKCLRPGWLFQMPYWGGLQSFWCVPFTSEVRIHCRGWWYIQVDTVLVTR